MYSDDELHLIEVKMYDAVDRCCAKHYLDLIIHHKDFHHLLHFVMTYFTVDPHPRLENRSSRLL